MAKLVIGIMYSDKELFEEVKKVLEKKFSKIEDSVSYDFNFTKYYEEEMGPPPEKRHLNIRARDKRGTASRDKKIYKQTRR